MLKRRSLAVLAAALMLGGPALAASPQTMTGAWVKVATAGTGACVTVTTDDQSGSVQVETSFGAPPVTDRGRIIHPFNPMSGAITSDLWAKGPAGATVAVDLGVCPGGGTGTGTGGSSGTTTAGLAADMGDPLNFIILF